MANFSKVQALMSQFNSLPDQSAFPRPDQTSRFRNDEANPVLIHAMKLKPVDMHKGAGFRAPPKPLMVKPNFTVSSMETRFNPLVSNKANGESSGDAGGVKLPNRGQAKPPSPAKSSVMCKPAFLKDVPVATETATGDLSLPKTKPLPSVFTLGKLPAKPERPPHVNLNKFRANVSSSDKFEPVFPVLPLPPPEHPSITFVAPPPPADFTFPPPPPHLMDETLEEDYYDDTDVMSRTQTSLGKSSNDPEESDEEMYEDIEQNWPEHNQETKEEKTAKESKELKKKLEKEEKKRLEQEKKERKEKEKRLQEARKKFKIKGVIEVVETGKARVDHKGGKNKLPLKQRETIEILRKTGNPKDYWLARNSKGHYGFVKPDTLDVVYKGATQDGQEVYDDVGADDVNNLPDVSSSEHDADVYECSEDQQADFSFLPPPSPVEFDLDVGYDDDTYDDVIPTDFPPPPPPVSFSDFSSPSETAEKKKKFEKEEKEFRKKFKYNAEIKVLYQATVLPSLSVKKFTNKDLPIKPGEMIDVIIHPVDDRLIGRNSEGKIGYVSTANLEQTGSLYDDVGDVCIYDND